MRRELAYVVVALSLSAASVGYANAPSTSQRPLARPDTSAVVRPDFLVIASNAPGLRKSQRPISRPHRAAAIGNTQRAPERVPAAAPAGRIGSVCGHPAILGQNIPSIAGKLNGCGVDNPVRISSVAGVALSQSAIMDCRTAGALNRWVRKSVKPTVGRLGGGVSGLRVVAHYSCRTRNSQPGAKISEHGKGHAVDIAAILLKNGTSLSVLKGWRDAAQGKLLKSLHSAACGPFGTVLGPAADRFHQDHFHLDTARHRSGTYCR